jgi:hypothetical protein
MTDLNLKPQDLDRLGQALLTLAKELWIVKDRVRVLEAALADANVIVADTVDRGTGTRARSFDRGAARHARARQAITAGAGDRRTVQTKKSPLGGGLFLARLIFYWACSTR